MAKIYTDEEICYLRKNPNVRTIRHDRLSLTYEFRCHLYDAYMTSGRSGMRAALEQAGGARILLRKLICSFLPAPSYGKTMASPSPMTSYPMWLAIIRMLR